MTLFAAILFVVTGTAYYRFKALRPICLIVFFAYLIGCIGVSAWLAFEALTTGWPLLALMLAATAAFFGYVTCTLIPVAISSMKRD
ncbi:hypothetical protein AC244_16245 [Ensifer adhaerens]|uniref:Uncharacterized protein n=1 Tax=Ensifer adhaerens TaxID=106592 RepID=A0A0L8BTK2_ENSAD|nr:hypothetical protein [Ensifer adhaerens]KOF17908.1 hypothetical protein AC244_16245 [Ensifer adhaerens]